MGFDIKFKEGWLKFMVYEEMNIKLFYFMLKFKWKLNRIINIVFWKILKNGIRSGSYVVL